MSSIPIVKNQTHCKRILYVNKQHILLQSIMVLLNSTRDVYLFTIHTFVTIAGSVLPVSEDFSVIFYLFYYWVIYTKEKKKIRNAKEKEKEKLRNGYSSSISIPKQTGTSN